MSPKEAKKMPEIEEDDSSPSLATVEREQGLAQEFEDLSLDELIPNLADPEAKNITEETIDAVQELVGSETSSPELLLSEPSPSLTGLPLDMASEELQIIPDLSTAAVSESQTHDEHAFDLSPVPEGMEIVKELCATTEANKHNSLIPVPGEKEDRLYTKIRWQLSSRLFDLVASHLSFNELVETSLSIIAEALGAEAGSVLELDLEKNEFFFRASFGNGNQETLKTFRVPCMQGIVGTVAESGKVLLLRDLEEDQTQLRAISMSTGLDAKSCLAGPVIIGGQLYGVVEFFNKKHEVYFNERDTLLLEDAIRMFSKVLEVRFLVAELVRGA